MKQRFYSMCFLLLLIFISVLIMNVKSQLVYAEAPLLQESKIVTTLDSSGNVVSGPVINLNKSIIPIVYNRGAAKNTSELIDTDLTVSFPNTNKYIPYQRYTDGKNTVLPTGTLIKLGNISYFRGKPLTLTIIADRPVYIELPYTNSPPKFNIITAATGNDSSKSSLNLTVWFEDYTGNKIVDSNVNFLLPFYNTLLNKNADYVATSFETSRGLENVIITNDKNQIYANAEIDDSNFPKSVTLIHKYSSAFSSNIVSPFSESPLVMSLKNQMGSYPNGTPSTTSVAGFYFFGTTNVITVPLKLGAPEILDTKNDENLKVNINVFQNLYQQSKDSFYPNSVDIYVTMPELVKTTTDMSNITLTDQAGKNIKNSITATSPSEGTLKFTVSNSQLKTLGNNLIMIGGEFQLTDNNSQLINYFNKDTGYFELPIEAHNSDSYPAKSEGVAKLKMPAPKGDPVTAKVEVGSSTSDLNADDLVTNLSSVLSEDKIEVVGFKESKAFDVIGTVNVIIQIKSGKTGVLGEIVTPITVVEQEKAQLSWDKDKKQENKITTVDKSELEDSLEEVIYWQAPYINRKYQLVVKGNDNEVLDSITTQESKDTSSWNSQIIKLPVNSLEYDGNDIVVEIHAIDNNEKPKDTVLDKINLNLKVLGSLKLKQIPSRLSWTERTSGEMKGILPRDGDNLITLSVVDTRNLSENQKKWSLRAQATSDESVPFKLVWKTDLNDPEKNLESELLVLTKDQASKTDDIYKKIWDEHTGILLKSENYIKVGDYNNKVTVTWKLYDTVVPE